MKTALCGDIWQAAPGVTVHFRSNSNNGFASISPAEDWQLIRRNDLTGRELWETLPLAECPLEWYSMLKATEQVVEWKVDDDPWRLCADTHGVPVSPELKPKHIYRITNCNRSWHGCKPLFKLFEMDWTVRWYPTIKGDADYTPIQVGCKAYGHWFIGFTDDPKWIDKGLFDLGRGEVIKPSGYETEPCDHTGFRKYAIGMLEVSHA